MNTRATCGLQEERDRLLALRDDPHFQSLVGKFSSSFNIWAHVRYSPAYRMYTDPVEVAAMNEDTAFLDLTQEFVFLFVCVKDCIVGGEHPTERLLVVPRQRHRRTISKMSKWAVDYYKELVIGGYITTVEG